MLTLNHSGRYVSHFDQSLFWLTNTSGATVLRGSVHENRRLHGFSLSNARTTHEPIASNAALTPKTSSMTGTNMPTTTLYASRTPDVETWHRRLGHCNFGAIVDMAQKGTVEGMAINLSSPPPKCSACILRKQTRSPASIVGEGEKPNRPLERMFVDLRGPIRPVSSLGRLYSMSVINEYSGYVWSLPPKSKGEAASILQKWHHAVENPSGSCLQTLVSDNGELVSNPTTWQNGVLNSASIIDAPPPIHPHKMDLQNACIEYSWTRHAPYFYHGEHRPSYGTNSVLHQRTSPTSQHPPPFRAVHHLNCGLTVAPLYPTCAKLAAVRSP